MVNLLVINRLPIIFNRRLIAFVDLQSTLMTVNR